MKITEHTAAGTAPAALRVSLTGSNALGRSFIIDAADWEALSPVLGRHWNALNKGARPYIYSSRKRPVQAMPELASGPFFFLSRAVFHRATGRVSKQVFFRNGNTLDLRAANLVDQRDEVVARKAAEAVNVTPYEGD